MLDKLALDKEQQTLQEENQQLRSVLKQYLDGEFGYAAFTLHNLSLVRACTLKL